MSAQTPEPLPATITALEAQRALLGDVAVDSALERFTAAVQVEGGRVPQLHWRAADAATSEA